jgi:serine/threonine protein kinase
MEGTPFGRYTLLELLGRGGMGEVWRAYDSESDRIVALKVLPPNLAGDDMFQKRFRREARVAAGLNEPHIVPIHGYGEIDGRLYVDMRLIVGRDLEAMLAHGPLEPARAVRIVEQVGAALHAAHSVGLIHRDVKPSNILIAKGDFAYLIDFGIARTVGDTGLTSAGSTIGTWAYMSPERFSDGEPDPRSDVYALACVLHQCLTGELPFPGETVEKQVAGHLSKPPPQPSMLNHSVPHAIDDVIANGMAKNPDRRYPSTVDLAQAARAAMSAPARPTAQPRAYTPIGVEPTWIAPPSEVPPPPRVDSSQAFTQFRGTQVGPPASYSPPAQPVPAPPEPPKGSLTRRGILIPAIVAVVVLVAGAVLAITQPWKKDADSTAVTATATTAAATTPPAPAGPTFDGTFTTSYGPQTEFNGTPINGLVEPATWVIRSACGQNGCVAAGTTVNRPEGVLTRVFDYVDGSWVSVTAEPGADCTGAPAQRWGRSSVQPRPDGSFAGVYSTAFDDHASTCTSSTSPITLTRTGDADPGVQTADLSTVPARVVSPAQGFRGHYDRLIQYTVGSSDKYDDDFVADAFCLRTGDRCLNYLYNDKKSVRLDFAAGQWMQLSSAEDTCVNGSPQHDEFSTTYPLPQPSLDPIPVVTGHGSQTSSGGCTGTKEYDITYTRTGD